MELQGTLLEKLHGAKLELPDGTLTPEEVAAISELLKKADGKLLYAGGACLVRCGSGAEAVSIAQAVVSNRSAPAKQFCWAVFCMEGVAALGPSRGIPLYRLVNDQLLERTPESIECS